jgi:hypothetical protein
VLDDIEGRDNREKTIAERQVASVAYSYSGAYGAQSADRWTAGVDENGMR